MIAGSDVTWTWTWTQWVINRKKTDLHSKIFNWIRFIGFNKNRISGRCEGGKLKYFPKIGFLSDQNLKSFSSKINFNCKQLFFRWIFLIENNYKFQLIFHFIWAWMVKMIVSRNPLIKTPLIYQFFYLLNGNSAYFSRAGEAYKKVYRSVSWT